MKDYLQIETINQIGQRENLEDFVMYKRISKFSYLFLVCDGVGGLSKGEIASELACKSILDYFKVHLAEFPSETDIKNAVDYCINCFDKYVVQHPESKGMATTLTLLVIQDSSALIAHIGDSRIYHMRDGKILSKTSDHSFVNDLIKTGYITEQEAKNHPKRNAITRAIQDSSNEAVPDVRLINNLAVGDFFMLCTDGILEGIDDEYIMQNFRFDNNVKTLSTLISKKCTENSTDNFSAIIIKVLDILGVEEINIKKSHYIKNSKPLTQNLESVETKPPNKKQPTGLIMIISLIMVISLISFGLFFLYNNKSENKGNSKLKHVVLPKIGNQSHKIIANSTEHLKRKDTLTLLSNENVDSTVFRLSHDTIIYSNGDKYIGSLENGNRSGYGVYIVAKNAFLKYCPGCCIYKGKWQDNKKNGIGKCYDLKGKLLYSGKFLNDKPMSSYPSH